MLKEEKKHQKNTPMSYKQTIVLDFDGVIHKYSQGYQGKIYDPPVDGTQEALVTMLDKGFKLVIHTAYPNLGEVKDWMVKHFGEAIGSKIIGNPYKIEEHLWVPFSSYGQKHLRYKSWGKYPKDFKTISEWFKELMPLFTMKRGDKEGFAEGVVFTHPDGRMAKLRKDMFEWYKGKRQ